MGSAASAYREKPLDCSDITDLDAAKKELAEVRVELAKAPVVVDEDWKTVAERAKKDKTGWTVYKGKVLLGNASLFYQQPVLLEKGHPIPWNETHGWWEEGGSDHWFEIPLNTPAIQNDIGMYVPGKLFTTRMPRALDMQEGEDWSTMKIPAGKTDKRRFMENVKDFSITHAWVLVEEFEMEKIESKCLLDFYKSLGITVHHTPVPDFTVPSLEIERDNIEGLSIALTKGENCIVHCMGGTGRTGTVIIGAVQNLGLNNAIKHCRKYGKSTYLEIAEQEEALQHQSKVLSKKMLEQCPHLSMKIILDQVSSPTFSPHKILNYASPVLLTSWRNCARRMPMENLMSLMPPTQSRLKKPVCSHNSSILSTCMAVMV
jgi:protein-tyrosine phosphatase